MTLLEQLLDAAQRPEMDSASRAAFEVAASRLGGDPTDWNERIWCEAVRLWAVFEGAARALDGRAVADAYRLAANAVEETVRRHWPFILSSPPIFERTSSHSIRYEASRMWYGTPALALVRPCEDCGVGVLENCRPHASVEVVVEPPVTSTVCAEASQGIGVRPTLRPGEIP